MIGSQQSDFSGDTHPAGFHRTVATVAVLNLAYFGVEIAVAIDQRSVALFADGIDFLEDASINAIILLSLALSAAFQRRAGYVLAAIILVPGFGALWAAASKIAHPAPPAAEALGFVGVGALAVNAFCALRLARFRRHDSGLVKAAFLSARNDVYANLAIIAAGAATAFYPSIWPDIAVGVGIFLMNADAAREVVEASRRAKQEAMP